MDEIIIRHGLDEDECLSDAIPGSSRRELFLGLCTGIMLTSRSEESRIVSVVLLLEDEGVWFDLAKKHLIHSYWLPELRLAIESATEWLEQNAVRRPTGGWEFRPVGWKFRPEDLT
jgi:hypothetical protein